METLRFFFHFFLFHNSRVPFEHHTKLGVVGAVRTEAYRWYTAGITGTGHFGNFGTTSIPVPQTSVSSVRH